MSAVTPMSRSSAGLVALAMGTTGFVVVAVNVLIYWARGYYFAHHPDVVSRQPATVSQALSDKVVGPFFATWMLICAPILLIGVLALLRAAWWEYVRSGVGSADERRRLLTLSGLVGTLQAMASVGMIMLSHFRFPDNHGLHMAGSYLFFFSQAFVIVFGEMLSRRYAAQPVGASILAATGCRIRRIYVWVPIVLGISYLILFILKGYDLGPIYDTAYLTYTLTELMLISSFLGYLLMFHVDMGQALWTYWRARSMAASI